MDLTINFERSMRVVAAALTSTLIVVFSATQLSAEPISVFGLNWSVKSMPEEVESKGYKCEPAEASTIRMITKKFNEYLGSQCKIDKKVIFLTESFVMFPCAHFNGCGFTGREVADSLLKNGVVPSFEMEIGKDSFGDREERFCHKGDMGDRLCVVYSVTNDPKYRNPYLILDNYTYGKGEMTFN